MNEKMLVMRGKEIRNVKTIEVYENGEVNVFGGEIELFDGGEIDKIRIDKNIKKLEIEPEIKTIIEFEVPAICKVINEHGEILTKKGWVTPKVLRCDGGDMRWK